MWCVGIGLGVTIALSWATVQLVQAWAEQGVEPQPAQAHDLSPGAASGELSTISARHSLKLPGLPLNELVLLHVKVVRLLELL